ncbi:TonB-dependent receptor plug domain-containing protein [Trinickia diaoshuihuensis]|uniref:TonB-dependent receptor plug domain-containing protein n=1 Tax=Trinickia diaoshuihuensis TaxID=2292265 RepID=UPI000E23305D|nr:TonB-dependent receptor [Trinickia diaoshuihuensis]
MSLEIKTIGALSKAFLSLALSVVLAIGANWAWAEPTADAGAVGASAPAGASGPVGLKKIVVTGSRIPRSEKEGTTSVTVITSKDLETKGYRNVFDAISQQTQNTGFTQGADYGNTFTPAANAISLRGLGPNHTLVLVDGRRVADYPVAYDGNVNFVNLANVPSAMIDRIEILNGPGSAVYGSDAIAGVVNIITKKHIDGIEVNVKGGTTEQGGGANGRLQITGGKEFGNLSTVFGIELSKTNPVWSDQRDFMSSTTLEGESPTSIWSRRNLDSGSYLGGPGACGSLSGIGAFGGSVSAVDTGHGIFCGSGKAKPTFWTTQTNNASENLYAGVEYRLSDKTTLFGSVWASWDQTKNNTRGPNWTSAAASTNFFFNQTTGADEQWSKRFSPEEIGGASVWDKEWNDAFGNVTIGVRGKIGDSSWNYEAAYNASGYESRATVPRLFSSVDNYYLGPQLGVTADGTPIYAPNPTRFATPLTPAQFAGLYGESASQNDTWTQNFTLSANGDLFRLPAGMVRAAGALEFGMQGFKNTPDPLIDQGAYYNQSDAQAAGGTRKRYAAALELDVPIFHQLNATLAGRYDDYAFSGKNAGQFTYNLGLEYRPLRSLLARGYYGTSFRAPDMNYLYQSKTKGYFESTTDYYRCSQAGQPISNCSYANVSPGSNYVQTGNDALKPENAKSWGYGFVFSPTADLDVSADYYDIRIDNLVTVIDQDNLLHTEAACRTGQLDVNSADCQDALRRVLRNPMTAVLDPGAINTIFVNPINAAVEHTSGFDVGGKWRWRTHGFGSFLWTVNYTKVLSHTYQQFANGPTQDLLHSLQNPTGNPEWPDKLAVSLTWSIPKWTSTIQVERYGKVPNAAQTAYLSPTALANLSVSHDFTKHSSLTLVVNNLMNTIKHDDSAGWPYYTVGYYMPYGRTFWLEFDHRFD